MALQDLTPQLRTRLSRVERLVGFFILVATVLLVTGFFYYIYHTAQRKGWFLTKGPYFTFVGSAAGLKTGDPVKLMGFDVGEITKIEAMPPSDPMFNVYVEFNVRAPYFGYLWSNSVVKLTSGDFLGNRFLEVTKGTDGRATYIVDNNPEAPIKENSVITGILDNSGTNYTKLNRRFEKYVAKDNIWKRVDGYWLRSEESPALTEQLDKVVKQVEAALPGFMSLTNQVAETLTNTTRLMQRVDTTVAAVQPVVTNMAAISAQLSNPKGSLGEWLIPTNINSQLQTTLASVHSTVGNANTNMGIISSNLNLSLANLADITSNLNNQVQANHLLLSEVSSLVVNADDFVQGLKRNWLLKSSFNAPTNTGPQTKVKPGVGGAP